MKRIDNGNHPSEEGSIVIWPNTTTTRVEVGANQNESWLFRTRLGEKDLEEKVHHTFKSSEFMGEGREILK